MTKRKIINNHYTLETRTIIENRLNEGYRICEIAGELNRDNSNIAKEINKHKVYAFPTLFNKHPRDICLEYDNCSEKYFECFRNCKKIKIKDCEKLLSSPHVCNGCNSKKTCKHVKLYYKATTAESEYKNLLSTSRKGNRYDEYILGILNNDFYNMFLNNRSINHTIAYFNSKGFNFTKSTIYAQIKNNEIRIKSKELPLRKSSYNKDKQDKSYKRHSVEGMTMEDYEKYKEEHPNAVEMQMDTVVGTNETNEPAMLTLQIVKIKFLFIFKIERHTAEEVKNKLANFKNTIGEKQFNKLMQILLTDNGPEFINTKFLIDALGEKVHFFYCHPYSSYEKGSIENNHEQIRKIIPKGVNLSIYTQDDYNLIMSHTNSLIRESLDNKCPFDLINNYLSNDILQKFNIQRIKPEDVILIPKLLKRKNIENIKKYISVDEIKKNKIFID